MEELLEHKILGVLIQYSKSEITRIGSDAQGYTPIYKKNYWQTSIHFGTLVDILNNPQKYTSKELPTTIADIVTKDDKIEIKIHSYEDVSNAIEVLAVNGHVEDDAPKSLRDEKKTTVLFVLPTKALLITEVNFTLKRPNENYPFIEGMKYRKERDGSKSIGFLLKYQSISSEE